MHTDMNVLTGELEPVGLGLVSCCVFLCCFLIRTSLVIIGLASLLCVFCVLFGHYLVMSDQHS